MEYINNSFDYAVPHSAFILTKSNSIEQFKSSKILVPYKQSKITKNNVPAIINPNILFFIYGANIQSIHNTFTIIPVLLEYKVDINKLKST